MHRVAKLLEQPWLYFTEEVDYSLVINHLCDKIRKDQRFFALISTEFLSSRYCLSVQVAASRILLACRCSLELKKNALNIIMKWLVGDRVNLTEEDSWQLKYGFLGCCSEHEMADTYFTGLLGMWLRSGQEIEDNTASSLARNLMHYLQNRVLNTSAHDIQMQEVRGESDTPAHRLAQEIAKFQHIMPNHDSLGQLREMYCIQCLVELGSYVGILGPVIQEKGVEVCSELLKRYSDQVHKSEILIHVMKMIASFASYRKFAKDFVDGGGIQKLLVVPINPSSLYGVSRCLVEIGSFQDVMKCICAFSSVLPQLIELEIELLGSPHDKAQQNAMLFLTNGFRFQSFVEEFDEKAGLEVLLSLLEKNTIKITSNSEITSSDVNLVFLTCVALENFFKANLMLLVRKFCSEYPNRNLDRNILRLLTGCEPLDISEKAMDAVYNFFQDNQLSYIALLHAKWPACQRFLDCNGHIIMLDLCQGRAAERFSLIVIALRILHMVTLVPYSREPIIKAKLVDNRTGITVLLEASSGMIVQHPCIIQQALKVLINLVCPSEAMDIDAEKGVCNVTPKLERNYHLAREALRSNNGIKILLQFLDYGIVLPHDSLDCLHASCRVLLGLARDDEVVNILKKLQVAKKLLHLYIDLSFDTSSFQRHAELAQTVLKLLRRVENYGSSSTLAASIVAPAVPIPISCNLRDSLTVQCFKHTHCKSPVPITTIQLPHICCGTRRDIDASSNLTVRLHQREVRGRRGGR